MLRAAPPYLDGFASLEGGSGERVQLKVTLSDGRVASISPRRDNHFGSIHIIVENEFGTQPDVHVGGRCFSPTIMAKHKGKWVPVTYDATVDEVGQTEVKFAGPEDVARFSAKHHATASWCDTDIPPKVDCTARRMTTEPRMGLGPE